MSFNLTRRIPSTYRPSCHVNPDLLDMAKRAVSTIPYKANKDEMLKYYTSYLFYNRHTKYAYCTCCDSEIPFSKDFLHKAMTQCPKCGKKELALCITRYKDGRVFLEDAEVEYMVKGRIKGSVCTCISTFYNDIRIVRGRIEHKIVHKPSSVLVILPDNRRVRFLPFFNYAEKTWETIPSKRLNFVNYCTWYRNTFKGQFCCAVAKSTVKGTALEHYYDCVPRKLRDATFLSMMTDDVEKLLKAGLTELANALCAEYRSQLNSSERSTLDTLPQGELHKVLGITPAYLRKLRMCKSNACALESAQRLSENIPVSWIPDGIELDGLSYNISRLQKFKVDVRRVLMTYKDHLTEYIDYLAAFKEIGEYADENKFLYPKNLMKAHDRTLEKLQAIRDKRAAGKHAKEDEKIQAFAEMLSMFSYSNGTYIIRPLRSVQEMYEESRKMSHCIKTYTDKYSQKRCSLFTVRAESDPDQPLVSVEINHDRSGWFMVQARAKHNAAPETEIKEFLDMWLNHIKELSLRKENKKIVRQLYAA